MVRLIWVAWVTKSDALNYYTGKEAWEIKDAPLRLWGGTSGFQTLLLFKNNCAMKSLIRFSKMKLMWQKIRSLCGRSGRKDDGLPDNPYLIL